MARDNLSKYIWLLDTIRRHGRITLREINELWMRSEFCDGNPLPRRSFFNYKQAIQDIFNINLECDPKTYEYYIDGIDEHSASNVDWLLNSAATNSIISSASDISHRVFLEDVPSAREHLAIVVEAIRSNCTLRFDYHSYYRSLPNRGVEIEPYFVKIFKQIWYVVGRNVKEGKIKTYALDRMTSVSQTSTAFEMPADFDPAEYFRYAFGIVVDKGEPKNIKLRVDPTTAKYLRALPLHHSQHEMVHDDFSIFSYQMLITNDLVAELLSRAPQITVLEPKELRIRMQSDLRKALDNYK